MLWRTCTVNYKIKPLQKAQKELAGVKRRQKDLTVTSWIGISWDEIQRVNYSKLPWLQHRWPLLEKRMSRKNCKEWMEANGYPEPPRSSCYFCPFHSNKEWLDLKLNSPKEFQKAVWLEKELQKVKAKTEMKTVPYFHRLMIPLDEVPLEDTKQLSLFEDEGMEAECLGMCGI